MKACVIGRVGTARCERRRARQRRGSHRSPFRCRRGRRRPTRVLFLCTGNSCRSQMGEGLLRHLGGDRFEPFSAGTVPADEVHPLAVETMRDRGIDISHQRPKALSEFDGREFDLLITTCDSANEECPLYPGARKRLHWSLPDPAQATGTEEEIREAFKRVADELQDRIRKLPG